jgi:hypothetical protein
MESIARELNLSPAELGALVLMPTNSLELLGKRLSRAGLSEQRLAGASRGDARFARGVQPVYVGRALRAGSQARAARKPVKILSKRANVAGACPRGV